MPWHLSWSVYTHIKKERIVKFLLWSQPSLYMWCYSVLPNYQYGSLFLYYWQGSWNTHKSVHLSQTYATRKWQKKNANLVLTPKITILLPMLPLTPQLYVNVKKNLIIKHHVEKWLVGCGDMGGRCDGDEGDVSRKIMSTKKMYIFFMLSDGT